MANGKELNPASVQNVTKWCYWSRTCGDCDNTRQPDEPACERSSGECNYAGDCNMASTTPRSWPSLAQWQQLISVDRVRLSGTAPPLVHPVGSGGVRAKTADEVIDGLEQEIRELRVEVSTAKRAENHWRIEFDEATKRLIDLSESAGYGGEQETELDELDQHNAELRKENKELKTQLERAYDRLQRAETIDRENADVLSTVDLLRSENRDLKAETAQMRTKYGVMREALLEARRQRDTARQQAAKLRGMHRPPNRDLFLAYAGVLAAAVEWFGEGNREAKLDKLSRAVERVILVRSTIDDLDEESRAQM